MNAFMLLMLQKYSKEFKKYTYSNPLYINHTMQAWYDNEKYVIYYISDGITVRYTLNEITSLLLSNKELLAEIIMEINNKKND